jgi:hypothetical protein
MHVRNTHPVKLVCSRLGSRNGRDQAVKFSYVSLEQRVRQDLPLQ